MIDNNLNILKAFQLALAFSNEEHRCEESPQCLGAGIIHESSVRWKSEKFQVFDQFYSAFTKQFSLCLKEYSVFHDIQKRG